MPRVTIESRISKYYTKMLAYNKIAYKITHSENTILFIIMCEIQSDGILIILQMSLCVSTFKY